MSNPVTIIGMRETLRSLSYLSENINDLRLMREIGLFLISQIQIRTAEGKDVDGNAFTPYSPSYRHFRESKGHSGSKVNLFFSGSMMSAMTFTATDDAVTLFFQNTSDPSGARNPEKAFFHNTGAAPQPERRFFAISDNDRQGVRLLIDDHLRRIRRRR